MGATWVIKVANKRPGVVFTETVYAPAMVSLLGALPIGTGAGVLFGFIVLELGVWGQNPLSPALSALVYVAAILFTLVGLLVLNFTRLTVTATSDGLRLQMGALGKTIPWRQVRDVRLVESGPRILSRRFFWSLFPSKTVWKMVAVPTGVEILVRDGSKIKRYYVSSLHRHELSTIIKTQLKAGRT